MTSVDKSLWEDLVVAILSVNQYSLEKTYFTLTELRREGLLDPDNLMHWTSDEVAYRLKKAGYDRGQFMTNLFAKRLSSLGKYLQKAGSNHCEKVLASGSPDEIKQLLLPVKGIGPKVVANFFLLRGIGPIGARDDRR